MGEQNNFKLLGEEEDNQYPHPPPETEMGIMGNVRVFNFVSNVLELYLPKVFEMFISMVGGVRESSNIQSRSNSSDDKADSPDGNEK